MDSNMVDETVCSHCGSIGHNSETCNSGESACNSSSETFKSACNSNSKPFNRDTRVMLFGVDISSSPTSMKRSVSMDVIGTPDRDAHEGFDDQIGYHSDGLIHDKRAKAGLGDRKKGTPWTLEEHKKFLDGLSHLGKGNWRDIAKNYVITRTPSQVASHAQKYYKRISNSNNKRRSSLFDITLEHEIPQYGMPSTSLLTTVGTSSQVSNQIQYTNNFPAHRYASPTLLYGHHHIVDRVIMSREHYAAFVYMMNYHPIINNGYKSTTYFKVSYPASVITHSSEIPIPAPSSPHTTPTSSSSFSLQTSLLCCLDI